MALMILRSFSQFWGSSDLPGVELYGCLVTNGYSQESLGQIGCWRSFCRTIGLISITVLQFGSRLTLECRFPPTPSLLDRFATLSFGAGTATRFVSASEIILYDAPFSSINEILEILRRQLYEVGLTGTDFRNHEFSEKGSSSFTDSHVSPKYVSDPTTILSCAFEQYFDISRPVPIARESLHPSYMSAMLTGKRVSLIEPELLSFFNEPPRKIVCNFERTRSLEFVNCDVTRVASARYMFGGWTADRALIWIFWSTSKFRSGLFLLQREGEEWKLLETSHDEDWLFDSFSTTIEG